MVGFLIKKSFWDYWDRVGLMILLNLINLVVGIVGGVAYVTLLTVNQGPYKDLFPWDVLAWVVLILFGGLLFLLLGANSRLCTEIVYSRSIDFRDYKTFFKEKAKKSLLFYGVVLTLTFFIATGLQFYGIFATSMLSLVAFFFFFWVTLLLLFSVEYFFPLSNIMDDPFKKNVKKCFMLFFDNPGTSIGVSLISFFLLMMTLSLAFLLPGIPAISILWENLMKFLMLKYDYMEENPEADKKKIPWDILLRDEKEHLGHPSFRNIFQPWK